MTFSGIVDEPASNSLLGVNWWYFRPVHMKPNDQIEGSSYIPSFEICVWQAWSLVLANPLPSNSTAIRLAHQPLSLQPPQSPIKASPPAARLK